MLVKIKSVAFYGLDVLDVDVEVNIASRGLPSFDIVGLPNKSIDESRHRVKSAFQNSGVDFPNKKITVNLAPADVQKEGSFYDLPIAVGIYAAVNNITVRNDYCFFGELSLDGSLRYTKGVFLVALHAREKLMKTVFIPRASVEEASDFKDICIFGAEGLKEVFKYLNKSDNSVLTGVAKNICVSHNDRDDQSSVQNSTDVFKDIMGQEQAKRALLISAAGGHHLFMMGPPGVGKSLLANSMQFLLPNLSPEESIEVTKIYSLSGKLPQGSGLVKLRPFRSPHHTISYTGMVGGGHFPLPGEITLAHRGVLFLDEFCEYPRQVTEVLRQPIEVGSITITRSSGSVVFPSKFILIAAANPCRCGYYGDSTDRCTCTAADIKAYRAKISGPLLDRIDMFIYMRNISDFLLSKYISGSAVSEERENEAGICLRYIKENLNCTAGRAVEQARNLQRQRFVGTDIVINNEMNNSVTKKYCKLSFGALDVFTRACRVLQLSSRAGFKVLKVSRTIADLEQSCDIQECHISEALQYRQQGTGALP